MTYSDRPPDNVSDSDRQPLPYKPLGAAPPLSAYARRLRMLYSDLSTILVAVDTAYGAGHSVEPAAVIGQIFGVLMGYCEGQALNYGIRIDKTPAQEEVDRGPRYSIDA